MGDDGAAVGDEFLGVHRALGLFGLVAEDLKLGDGFVANWADRRTPAAFQTFTVQGQSVVGISSVTTVKGCMDGINSLLHLIGRSSFLGALGDCYRCAVQQPLVGVCVDVEPGGWRKSHRMAPHASHQPFLVLRLFQASP